MTECLTIVSLDNVRLSSDKLDANPSEMLGLAEVVNAEMDARKDELAAMISDLVMFGQCASLNGKRIPPREVFGL